jgi:integrase
MPATPGKVPAYSRHKASGRAVVRLNGRDHYLGPYGSPESHERYARLIADWRARPQTGGDRPVPLHGPPVDRLSINELLLAYAQFARGYFTKDGQPNQEFESLKYAMRPLKELYGHSRAADFGPRDLKAVRQHLVDRELSRTYVNNNTNRLKRIFKWAVGEELVPASVYHALQTVAGLRYGRSEARETEPIRPVPDDHVEVVLNFVAPPVAAMIRLQRLTGMRSGEVVIMRSGEVVIMRACDIDMSGEVWLYGPSDHKGKWRGQRKVIPLGPRAQAVIRPFLILGVTEYLFSPRDAEAWHLRQRSRKAGSRRKTPVYPCELRRRNCRNRSRTTTSKRKQTGVRYDPSSYRRAIRYGIEQAREVGFEVPHWHPHQLRHTKATEVRRAFGLEAAQVALGHARADVTEVYAERNLSLAVSLAKSTG